MRFVCRLLVLAGCFVPIGLGQPTSPTAAQLEAFERFAERSTARVAWSNEIGRIETDRARAVVTALIVEDAAEVAQPMRGIRIDLTEGDRTDRLYTSTDHLELLIYELERITRSATFSSRESDAPNLCHGSGALRLQLLQGANSFTASECVYGDWVGLAVGPGDFRFTNARAAGFAKLFAAARDALEKAGEG